MSDSVQDALLDLHRRVLMARRASQEERKSLLHDAASEVIHALIDNEGLSEDELNIILARKDISAEILQRLGNDKRVLASYTLKKAMVINIHTPASISLKFVPQLFTFDIVGILLLPALPREVRTASEELLFRKVPQLALGEKLTLARRTNADRVLALILDDNSREVVGAALNNAFLREGAICTTLRKPTVKSHTVELIAANAKWSCRYDVRYALLRTKHLPMGMAINFLNNMTPKDLRDLAGDPNVPMQLRTYIKNNLSARSQPNKKPIM